MHFKKNSRFVRTGSFSLFSETIACSEKWSVKREENKRNDSLLANAVVSFVSFRHYRYLHARPDRLYLFFLILSVLDFLFHFTNSERHRI